MEWDIERVVKIISNIFCNAEEEKVKQFKIRKLNKRAAIKVIL